MSSLGWQVIRAIEQGEKEVSFWFRYMDGLTLAERKRIGQGDYHALIRPWEPRFEEGAWLQVSPKLSVRVGATTFRRQAFRTSIAEVRDYRGGHAVDRRLHEDAENMTTIVPVNDWPADPPEPEKVPASVVRELPSTVAAWARHEREMAEARLALDETPIEERLRRLVALEQSGADIGRELRQIKGRLAEAERKAGLRPAA